jgi:hypothetical protein
LPSTPIQSFKSSIARKRTFGRALGTTCCDAERVAGSDVSASSTRLAVASRVVRKDRLNSFIVFSRFQASSTKRRKMLRVLFYF